MHVSADEYLDHVTENAAMKISFVGRVGETQQMLTMKDDFRLRIPDLQLKVLQILVFFDMRSFQIMPVFFIIHFSLFFQSLPLT